MLELGGTLQEEMSGLNTPCKQNKKHWVEAAPFSSQLAKAGLHLVS